MTYAAAAIAEPVGDFYERHPYPPPRDDIDAHRALWDDARRRAESHLLFPTEPYRDDRSILVAGCGTSQAAKYAVRWPTAKVVGIDLSAASLAFSEGLKARHGLDNLELRQLPIEQAARLDQAFDLVVCTGVLHHLPDPAIGLRALSDVLAPTGALHAMVYAPYGRAGIYLIQDYCRRLRIGATTSEIRDLAASLGALPPDHPLRPLLDASPDFRTEAGLADALLHPQDRAYSVPQLTAFLQQGGLRLDRWVRQAPYLPQCGAMAATPHAQRIASLPADEQYAALELFRGMMLRHSFVARRLDQPVARIDFAGDAWLAYVPIRLPDAILVREHLPAGATAVLLNRNHTCRDLYLPIGPPQEGLLGAINGARSVGEILRVLGDVRPARAFFEHLWRYDQIVFDMSGPGAGPTSSAPAGG